MQSTNKLAESDAKSGPGGEIPIDPFAVDFFGVRPHAADEPEGRAEEPEPNIGSGGRRLARQKSDWHRSLPRLTRRDAEFSALIDRLPEKLTAQAGRAISEAIARYTFRDPEQVRCAMLSVAEVDLRQAFEKTTKSPQIFLTLACRPSGQAAVLTVETEFAAAVVDLILGGARAEFSDQRELSPIELAIVEFLALSVIGEINRHLGEPLLCLQSVSARGEHDFRPEERGGEIVLHVGMENLSATIGVLAPREFLAALDRRENALLAAKRERRSFDEWERVTGRFDLRLQVGSTQLDADSLLFLEPDDIVLIERPAVTLERGLLGDNLQVSVGRGRNYRLAGATENDEFGSELFFRIREIISEETRRAWTPLELRMEETENDTTSAADAAETENDAAATADEAVPATLENVQVALRVEVGGNKISLRELGALRAGQIIALGCRPNDPVRLVTDQTEEPIATGELIEIEGQLGVRLTKVFI